MKTRLAIASILGTLAVIAANIIVPSYLNFYFWAGHDFKRWQKFIDIILELHRTQVAPFTRRPVTTFFVDQLTRFTLLPSWWSFILVQAFFLSLSTFVLARIAEQRQKNTGLATVAIYLLSFTVLFSFITPNDSYDEPAQYLFLFLALSAILNNRPPLFAISFFFALLARETSILLLPGLILLYKKQVNRSYGSIFRWACFAVPLILYGAYIFSSDRGDDPNRFLYWQKNFSSNKIAIESLISLILALALPMLLDWWATIGPRLQTDSLMRKAFLLSLGLNTPIVFLAAYARETRLFALPLIFLWPTCGERLMGLLQAFRNGNIRFQGHAWRWLLSLGLALSVSYFYQPAYRSSGPYRIYGILMALLLLGPLTLTGKKASGQNSTQLPL